ncbi:MAG: hypothetical protein K940chlam6_00770 [Chlamydiae bacterium]|nr:hypothetical protein [Chlamydiota bacterium]
MKVDFNLGITTHPLGGTPQIQQNSDRTRYQSFIRGAAPKSSFSFFLDLPFAIFRIFTFTFYRLFAQNPKLKGFYLPEMTKEKKAEYEKLLSGYWTDWNFHPSGRKGPSYQQKIQLFHEFYCLNVQGLDWWGKNREVDTKITIHINGKEYPCEPLQSMQGELYIEPFFKIISNPENYERGKDAQVDISFQQKCSIDHGYGPYRVYYSSLTCKNTLGADGKSITIQEANKRMRSRYSFFHSSANAPLR